MIVTERNNFRRYQNLNPYFPQVCDFLESTDLLSLAEGRYEIAGNNVYANVMSYISDGIAGSGKFETHDNYLDIHLVIQGKDKIAVAVPRKAKLIQEYDKNADIAFYQSEEFQVIDLNEFNLLVAFKEDFHQPKIRVNDKPVKKMVIKVKVE